MIDGQTAMDRKLRIFYPLPVNLPTFYLEKVERKDLVTGNGFLQVPRGAEYAPL
ncbi:MAG: hypothetical protein STSR0007_11170 [Thermovirga sp.]